jgi:hypothetical protein
MRTTEGKPVGERVLLGDPAIAGRLADALAARDPVDRFTHGFHTWPAGLHPDAARDLLAVFPGASLLDPFCGGGTVLVEGVASGRRVHGRDLSSIGIRVARARTSVASEDVLTRMRSLSRRLTEEARRATEIPPEPILSAVRQWYAKHVAIELEHIRRGIAQADPDVKPLLEVVFSSILVKVSWRKSDTSPVREKHDRPPGTTAILFHKKTRELGRRIAALREATPPGTPPADIRLMDARKVTVPEPVELVLTSPPYPSTYDYLPLQHLRRVWLGETGDRDDAEIGPRRLWREGGQGARKKWREDTAQWMKSAGAALAPGGHMVVVIGDGYAPGVGEIDTSEPTEAGARVAGLTSVARASLERPDHARGTSKWEHVFAFRR